ncbi:hypothetical protein [Streptomyces sulphureus]|uniref:hypothetical protein n=1 Tax=Streptomyces sulphureus TaxID=47758 RepID=UPI00055A554F|nr:hypothetical protein [Streptomyces sulphureus]
MAVGCGRHEAWIVDRDGPLVSTCSTLVSVEWARALDDTSQATIVVQPEADCCASLRNVRSWRHKLLIFRDGQPVWEGPIVTVEWTLGEVTVQAVDVLGWLDRRVPHRDMEFTTVDLTQIAAALIRDAFAPDDPGHEVQILGDTRIRGDRAYQHDVGQTGDHLNDLAKTGLDYTAVGSRIILLPEDYTERVGALTDEDFPDGLVIAEDGAALATRWIIHGKDEDAQDDEPGITGTAGGTHPYYGLLEQAADEQSILDERSATAAARSRLRGSQPAPLYIDTSQQTTLAPDAAVDVPSLVPGWCVDVTTTTTCRDISQSLKITGMKVSESASSGEQGGGERVSVQLAPVGIDTSTSSGMGTVV